NAMSLFMDYGEEVSRRALRELPKGRFSLDEEQDNGLVYSVTVEITDDSFVVDLRENPDQDPGSANLCRDASMIPAQLLFKNFTVVEPQLGGWGASASGDGNSAMFTGIHGDTFNCPVEVAEARYGLYVEQLAFGDAEGGAGEHRGGKGIVLDYRVRADGLFFT